MDIAGCHPDDLLYCPLSAGWHNIIWILSYPDELVPDRISSGWVTANSLCHPGDIHDYHLMSSGWLTWCCYLIRMSYGNIIMSSGWHTLLFLSHPDKIANFDFSQHVMALQRFCSLSAHYQEHEETKFSMLAYRLYHRDLIAIFHYMYMGTATGNLVDTKRHVVCIGVERHTYASVNWVIIG